MEPWLHLLRDGQHDQAWDSFLGRYQRLIFSAIRHYLTEHDDVMDVFAHVCGALRQNDFSRLRRGATATEQGARLSTWLVAVVRNQTVDWLRQRDGRPRRRIPEQLGPIEKRIFQLVITERRSHRDAFHLLAAAGDVTLSAHDFSAGLAAVYRAAPPSPYPSRDALRHPLPLAESLPAPVDATDLEDGARLEAAMATLPASDRLAVQLFVVDELPAADVARTLGWPSAKTVYNRVSRALKSLRVQLQKQAPPIAE